jgi:hypothetical protein
MHIYFVLSGIYPTKKAYGVTTRETIRALMEFGHKVEVVSRSEIETNFKNGNFVSTRFVKISEFLLKLRKISKIYFPVWQIIFAYFSKRHFKEKHSLIWIREPQLAMFYSVTTNNRILCEIHHLSRFNTKYIIPFLQKKKNVTLSPIKRRIAENLGLSSSEAPISFMSVSPEFISVGEVREDFRRLEPRIVVVGNATNRYQLESFRRLIKQIEECKFSDFAPKFTFVGLDEHFAVETLGFSAHSVSADFLGAIKHEDLPNVLAKSDIGIVHYLDNEYFLNTFPIKIVEYAATKNLILATNTRAHTDIIGNKGLFYDINDDLGLRRIIEQATKPNANLGKTINEAFRWAKHHTYKARAGGIMAFIDSVAKEK